MPAGKMFKGKRKKITPMVMTAIDALGGVATGPAGGAGRGISRALSKRLASPSPAPTGPGISPSQKELDYPTSAPSFSKRPQARPEPTRPRARPARIEQEAAEAAAVEGGNNEARRRASDTQNFYEGGSVRGCKSIQSSGTGFSGSY